MARLVAIAAALALSASASHADNCESIRAGIDAKIRASGVGTFNLAVVSTEARVPGKVVGTCALGTRKIVYVPAGAASSARPKSTSEGERILTECKDGSTSVGGDCKK